MVIEKIRRPELSWVGAPEEKCCIPELAHHKDVKFYKKCIFGHLSIKSGDFVLISDAESADPDTVDGCDVAQIICLYELNQPGKDPFQAYVQWYSRPRNVPSRHFDSDDICIDFDREVIEDYRPYGRSISVETIFGMCVVLKGIPEQSVSSILKDNKKSRFPIFVCRYKFCKDKRAFKLISLSDSRERSCKHTTNDPNSRTPKASAVKTKQTPKSKRPAETNIMELEFVDVNDQENFEDKTVTPIKIVNNVVMKVPKSGSSSEYNKNEINANYLLSPVGKLRLSEKGSKVCRNLSPALENGLNCTADSDIMNYSIIQSESSTQTDIKIKLRLSETQSAKKKQQNRREPDGSAETKNYLENLEVSPQKRRRGSVLDYGIQTPGKENKATKSSVSTPTHITETPRRRSILKTPSDRLSVGVRTPRRSIQLSNIVEEIVLDTLNEQPTPSRRKRIIQPSDTKLPKTPSTSEKRNKLPRTKSDLDLARESLHVGSIPESLPCRENEFQNIYSFLRGKIEDQCGGCMYISGVPGTGKTATVTSVIERLKLEADSEKINEFTFVEINGMRLTEPRQAYVQIHLQLTKKTLPWEQAQSLLEKRFFTNAPRRITTVLLVDELDILCNRRQDVVYNLLDWSTRKEARLVVITIANTMDLPERLLLGKVTSRLGLTRLTFQPYSHKQLQEIVAARLSGYDSFNSDAIQLVARKVAAVSGDARRALDISRRAAEIAEGDKKNNNDRVIVTMVHVQNALGEMIASANVQAIKSCSRFEQLFLQAVCAEITRTGIEETQFMGVYLQFESIASFAGLSIVAPGHALRICSKLGSQRLLICEHSRTDLYQKILLNVSIDDVQFALQGLNN